MAGRFWEAAGSREDFPRSLEIPVLWALPLAIVKIPRLGLVGIRDWLSRRRIQLDLPRPNRRLRGCLIARAGAGVVFLDGSDPDDERRFSLAHEVSHFLLEYHWSRERALTSLGEGVREVLDGLRLPTPAERLNSVLRSVTLGTFTDLLHRTVDGEVQLAAALEAEDRADRLALELLAPKAVAVEEFRLADIDWGDPKAPGAAQRILREKFGLPKIPAELYGTAIVLGQRGRRSFADWLGKGGESRRCRTRPLPWE